MSQTRYVKWKKCFLLFAPEILIGVAVEKEKYKGTGKQVYKNLFTYWRQEHQRQLEFKSIEWKEGINE